jgi:hypothetical protein
MSSDRNVDHFQFTSLPHGSVMVKLSPLVLTTTFYSIWYSREKDLLPSYADPSVPLALRVYISRGPAERISVKINIVNFFENPSRNSEFDSNQAVYMKAFTRHIVAGDIK